MPNGHDYSKEYGPHKYPNQDGTSDCEYDCDCWMGDARSGGPLGLDPAPYAECPGNPKDGKLVGGKADYEIVVERRIRRLERRAYEAEERLERVSPTKKRLAEELHDARVKLARIEAAIRNLESDLTGTLKAVLS